MWRHKRRNQIRSSSETDKSIYIGGGVSSVEYWLSWSAGRRRTIVVTLDGLFRVKLKTAGYPLHSPLSPSLLLPCVAVCHQIPFPLYPSHLKNSWKQLYFAVTNQSIVQYNKRPTSKTQVCSLCMRDGTEIQISLCWRTIVNRKVIPK